MDISKLPREAYTWLLQRGPALLLGIVLLFVGLWLINLFARWMSSRMSRKNIDPSLKSFFFSFVVALFRVLLILAVMSVAGVQMTIFAALLGAVGVAAGLALSGTLQNFTSGVIILFMKPFSVGDNILAQGQEGKVTAIRIFYTVVTTFDNRTVIIPNSKLSNEVIINISSSGRRRMDIELKFANIIDFDRVRELADQAIADCDNMLKRPERRIGISSIEPDGYKVMLNIWVNAHHFVDTKMAFQETLLRKLKDSGLKLAGM